MSKYRVVYTTTEIACKVGSTHGILHLTPVTAYVTAPYKDDVTEIVREALKDTSSTISVHEITEVYK